MLFKVMIIIMHWCDMIHCYFELAANRTTIKTTRQPRSLVVKEGTPFRLSFDVVCSSSEPIQYQWYFNGGKISGATSEIYIRLGTMSIVTTIVFAM